MNTRPEPSTGVGGSLRARSTDELLSLWAPLQAELARRFGNSNIVGYYGELLVARALRGRLRSNSAAGGDVELDDGSLIEVTCRRSGSGAGRNASGIYKWDPAIGGWPFDFAAFVQLDEETLRPVRAFMIEASALGEPKTFGAKSPVLGQQLHANRRYPDEIDLLPQMLGDGQAAGPSAAMLSPGRSQEEAVTPSPIRIEGPRTTGDVAHDWIWLSGAAIEEFKQWRVQRGASAASASSYASGARAFVRFCRAEGVDLADGLAAFPVHLERTRTISPRAASDYCSHARKFIQFLATRRSA